MEFLRSFRGETSYKVVKCRLFSQISVYAVHEKSAILQTLMSLPPEAVFKFPIFIGLELLGFVVIS